LKQIGEKHQRSAGEVALAWTLLNEAVTGAIVGGRTSTQVTETIGAAELKLTAEDVAVIEGK
jgi:aryl-alcohol dehydrogenase-like predicted oxidoreductase